MRRVAVRFIIADNSSLPSYCFCSFFLSLSFYIFWTFFFRLNHSNNRAIYIKKLARIESKKNLKYFLIESSRCFSPALFISPTKKLIYRHSRREADFLIVSSLSSYFSSLLWIISFTELWGVKVSFLFLRLCPSYTERTRNSEQPLQLHSIHVSIFFAINTAELAPLNRLAGKFFGRQGGGGKGGSWRR